MFFHVDPHNGLAVYEQIKRQLKFAVADGALLPGELAPSVRELAKELAINPNTVARAYRELQSDGVLEAVRGTGLAVSKLAPRQCREARKSLLAVRMEQVLHEAASSGLSRDEIEKLFRSALQKTSSPERKS